MEPRFEVFASTFFNVMTLNICLLSAIYIYWATRYKTTRSINYCHFLCLDTEKIKSLLSTGHLIWHFLFKSDFSLFFSRSSTCSSGGGRGGKEVQVE